MGRRGVRKSTRAKTSRSFLSIGYSTCHWCHVMERESFENEAIAELLNRWFVPIKVDREERPDIDRIYMNYVQATTGGGGWPMSVWLTPDLKPFVGGTYFPPDNRYGRAGFPVDPRTHRGGVAERPAEDRRNQRRLMEQLRAQAAAARQRRRTMSDAVDLRQRVPAVPPLLRFEAGRLRRRAEIPAPVGSQFPAALLEAHRQRRGARHGGRNADRHGKGRNERSAGRRLSSLFGGRILVRPAFRKDAVRSGAAGDFVSRSLPDHAATKLCRRRRAAHARLRAARHDGARRRVLVGRGCRQRGRCRASRHEKSEGAFYIWSGRKWSSCWARSARAGSPAAMAWSRTATSRTIRTTSSPAAIFCFRRIRRRTAHAVRRCMAREAENDPVRGARETAASASRRQDPDAWNGLMISAFAQGGGDSRTTRSTPSGSRARRISCCRPCGSADGTLLRRYPRRRRRDRRHARRLRVLRQGLLDLYEATFEFRYLDAAIALTEKQRELLEDESRRLLRFRARRRIAPDAHERRLRWRRAFRQFRRADELLRLHRITGARSSKRPRAN